MSFPETRNSLIFRLSSRQATEVDWQEFMVDYWQPLVRFARRIGAADSNAEDIASDAIGVLLKSDLLKRWSDHRASRLRGLLCGVVRNLVANQYRVEENRKRILASLSASGVTDGRLPAMFAEEPLVEDLDTFEHIWLEELVTRAFRLLAQQLYEEGKGDYFRALHAQVREERTVNEIAKLLELKVTQVENGLKAARRRLTDILRELVMHHVRQYSLGEDLESELRREWTSLAQMLEKCGGLDAALHEVAKERGILPVPTAEQGLPEKFRALLPSESPAEPDYRPAGEPPV